MINYRDGQYTIRIMNTKERLGSINFQVNASEGYLSINPSTQMGPDQSVMSPNFTSRYISFMYSTTTTALDQTLRLYVSQNADYSDGVEICHIDPPSSPHIDTSYSDLGLIPEGWLEYGVLKNLYFGFGENLDEVKELFIQGVKGYRFLLNERTLNISTNTEGVSIYYSTDNTDPANFYTENLIEKTGTTIKAQAYKDGLRPSIISRYIVN